MLEKLTQYDLSRHHPTSPFRFPRSVSVEGRTREFILWLKSWLRVVFAERP